MSVFPRIAPDHPLAEAARAVNAHTGEHGLEATLEWLGMQLGAGELAYLGEQRALRAVAAWIGLNMGGDSTTRAACGYPATMSIPRSPGQSPRQASDHGRARDRVACADAAGAGRRGGRTMMELRPVGEVRPGDTAYLEGRKTAKVERVDRTDGGAFVVVLDNGIQFGPMTGAYDVLLVPDGEAPGA